MKRSDFFIRLTTGLLFLAVASYIVVSLYYTFVNTFVTTAATVYSVEETLPSAGFIVRSETALPGAGAALFPVVDNGERVSVGQVVAIDYLDRESLEIASEIYSLEMKISQLESPRTTSDVYALALVMDLSDAIFSRDLSRLGELSLNLETDVFMLEADIGVLRRRLDYLSEIFLDTRTITAEQSGTFSIDTDGFEHIYPQMLTDLSPTELSELFETPTPGRALGKVITEFTWYYAAVMNSTDAARLSEGSRKTVRFYGNYRAEVEMTVESISRREDDKNVVLFSSNRGIHDVSAQRSVSAEIVSSVYTGILVPMEAVHLDAEGVTHVFLQTAGFAERVDIDIISRTDDYFVVHDGAVTGSPLRAGSIIIVRANNLYHGRVVS